jgi:hypothetical protein
MKRMDDLFLLAAFILVLSALIGAWSGSRPGDLDCCALAGLDGHAAGHHKATSGSM